MYENNKRHTEMNNDKVTTIAVISDTHSYLDPRIANLISECDYAIHAGDVCGVEVIEAMQPKVW